MSIDILIIIILHSHVAFKYTLYFSNVYESLYLQFFKVGISIVIVLNAHIVFISKIIINNKC